MDYEGKRSGQIPAFGNWDYANNLPLTQYFECARQAGLIPSASSLCQCIPCVKARRGCANGDATAAAADFKKAPLRGVGVGVPPIKASKEGNNSSRPPRSSVPRGAGTSNTCCSLDHDSKVCDECRKEGHTRSHRGSDAPRKQPTDHIMLQRERRAAPRVINVKPVDEDLYKIPSDVLHNSKKFCCYRCSGRVPRCSDMPA